MYSSICQFKRNDSDILDDMRITAGILLRLRCLLLKEQKGHSHSFFSLYYNFV